MYRIGRLTQPWLLEGTELLDRAVGGTYSENFAWPIIETLVPRMCAGHGVDFNFVRCSIVMVSNGAVCFWRYPRGNPTNLDHH